MAAPERGSHSVSLHTAKEKKMNNEATEVEQDFADFAITTQATSETLAGHAIENPSSDNGSTFWGEE